MSELSEINRLRISLAVGLHQAAENGPKTPEHRLLFLVLFRATLDWYNWTHHGGHPWLLDKLNDWLTENDEEPGPFSYRWICDQLNIDSAKFLAQFEHLDDAMILKIRWRMNGAHKIGKTGRKKGRSGRPRLNKICALG